jgi:hypothetical protein
VKNHILIFATAIMLSSCLTQQSGSNSTESSLKTDPVPGCNSGGDGIVNNPHCEPSTPEPEAPFYSWLREFSVTNGYSLQNQIRGLALDSSNNIITVGYTEGSFDGEPQATNDPDSFLIKHDSNGNKIWSRQFGSTFTDHPWAVTTDSSSDIYVTGGGVTAPVGFLGVFVTKFDAAGNLLWSKTFDSTVHEEGHSIAVDASGNLFIGGLSGNDNLLMKVSNSGSLIWKKTFGRSDVPDFIQSLKVSNDGHIYITGLATFSKLTLDGNLIWEITTNLNVRDVTISNNGDVYVAGTGSAVVDGNNSPYLGDAFLSKYNTSGEHLWTTSFGSDAPDAFSGIALDAEENIIATGYLGSGIPLTNNKSGALVTKYNSNGELLTAFAFGNSASTDALAPAVTTDNKIVIVGRTAVTSLDTSQPSEFSSYIMKLEP